MKRIDFSKALMTKDTIEIASKLAADWHDFLVHPVQGIHWVGDEG